MGGSATGVGGAAAIIAIGIANPPVGVGAAVAICIPPCAAVIGGSAVVTDKLGDYLDAVEAWEQECNRLIREHREAVRRHKAAQESVKMAEDAVAAARAALASAESALRACLNGL